MNEDDPDELKEWNPSDPVLLYHAERGFLERIVNIGGVAYRGPAGLFGGRMADRNIYVIHRGMGRRWEFTFEENNSVIANEFVKDFSAATSLALGWLAGDSAETSVKKLREISGSKRYLS